MAEFILQYWIEVLFAGALALMGIAMRMVTKKVVCRVEELEFIKLGMQALLRDRIIQAYNKYMAEQEIPIYGLDNVEQMYTQYHALGGNGTITKLMDDLRELPTKKREKGGPI